MNKMVNYFEFVKKLLENNSEIFWHYNLMGCAQITNITKNNKISFLDSKDNRKYLSEKEFNNYNQGCEIKDIIIIGDNNVKKNKYNLIPIPYKIYRKLRDFKYIIDNSYTDNFWKPMCYKDKKRVKFCIWGGGQKKWLDYVHSLNLKEGKHYVHGVSNSFRGPYPTIILYIE